MKLTDYAKLIFRKISRLIAIVIFIVPPIIFLLIAVFYLMKVASDLTQDTTKITNAAFAIMGSLAALGFAFSRAVDDDPLVKDHISFASERLLHAALLCLMASVMKYGVIEFIGLEKVSWREVFRFITGTIVTVLFFQAIMMGHAGIRILNKHLVTRVARKQDWDDIV